MTELQPYSVTLEERANGVAREWIALMAPAVELARIVSDTEFVPRGLRGKPDAIVAAILYGDSIGLDPMQSLAKIAVIDGRPSVSAEGVRGAILARGHRVWVVESTNTRAVVAGQRADDDRTHEATWTMDDAKRAGLASKSNWRSYPRQMLVARATADLARIAFADVLGGFPVTEEAYPESDDGPPPRTAVAGPGAAPALRTTRRRRSPQDPPEPTASSSPTPTESDTPAPDTGAGASPSPTEGEPAPTEVEADPEDAHEAEALLAAEREADTAANEAKLRRDLEASTEAVPPVPGQPVQPETGDAAVEAAEQTIARERAKANAAEPELITDPQRRKMNALFRERGVSTREARLAYCSTAAKRTVETSSDLTIEEAGRVIDALEQWDPSDPESRPFPVDPHDIPY